MADGESLLNENAGVINQLSDGSKHLDEKSDLLDNKMNISSNNKFVFLLQSFLLGASHSMIWPTVYTYVRDDLTSGIFIKIVYGLTYVAYPISSTISAKFVKKVPLSTKRTILMLNTFEIVGNLIYTLKYYALIPCLGRFIAGMGDAFYVVLMKEIKAKKDVAISEKITVECLVGFILGVVFAPIINILTTFMHFKVGTWTLNVNNFPGLTMACLFLIAQFVTLFSLDDDGQIYDTKKTEENESESFDEENDPYFIADYAVIFIAVLSFFYTYIVATLELMIPLIMYEICHILSMGSMLIYAAIATIYAVFLLLTMTITFKNPIDVYLGITVFMQTISLSSLLYLTIQNGADDQIFHILWLGVIAVSLACLWSNDDIFFINFMQATIDIKYRKASHGLRKVTSRLAFCIAGVTAPFTFTKGFAVLGPFLIVLIFVMFIFAILVKYYSRFRKS